MGNKPLRRKKPSHPYKNLPLDIAIGLAGILLLGFIYSLSQNTIHTGVPIKVSFPEINEPKMLAKEIYNPDTFYNDFHSKFSEQLKLIVEQGISSEKNLKDSFYDYFENQCIEKTERYSKQLVVEPIMIQALELKGFKVFDGILSDSVIDDVLNEFDSQLTDKQLKNITKRLINKN